MTCFRHYDISDISAKTRSRMKFSGQNDDSFFCQLIILREREQQIEVLFKSEMTWRFLSFSVVFFVCLFFSSLSVGFFKIILSLTKICHCQTKFNRPSVVPNT